jgi:uncharacterized repeat protein (TIGR01451 family)
MKNYLRYLLIAAILLTFSSFLLQRAEATRAGLKAAAPESAAPNYKSASVGWLQEEEPPQESADLSVTKVVDLDQVTPGMNLTYTITVRNNEPRDIALVTLDDPLPAGTTFVSLTKPVEWICTTPPPGDPGTVNCTNALLAANSESVFTLVVNVPASTEPGTFFTNTATVGSATPDTNEENNTASAVSIVAGGNADLSVNKTASPEPVRPDGNLTYTITVLNNSTGNADDVTLTDVLPGNLEFVSLTKPNDDWSCTTPAVGATGTITCTNPSLAANSNEVFTLVAHVPADTPTGTTYDNTATVSTSTNDLNEENNSSTVTTLVLTPTADLAVEKVDTPDPANPGANITYNITITNNGLDAAAAASLSDTIPAGTTFVSLTKPNDDWTCTTPAVGATGTVSCGNASFAPGSALFILVLKVDTSVSAGTVITNTVTVSTTTDDPDSGNNTGMATTTIVILRGWTTTGASGVTEDESNPARPAYTNFTAALNTGSPAGTYVFRYNIQAVEGLSGAGSNTRLRVRFRDEGEGSRVTVAIMGSPITGGVATLGTVFDSDTFTPGNGFQTQEVIMSAVTFDFAQNTYWLEVTMTKAGTSNQPGFGSAQINRQ